MFNKFYRCLPFLALLLALSPAIALAGTIAVDGTTCTLPEAVGVANQDTTADGCILVGGAAGDADTLNLAAGTHALDGATLYNNQGNNGVPPIISEITVVGQGAGATIERTGSEKYRLFYVAMTGTLTISNVTVINFHTSGIGGAIQNLGNLTLVNSSLISNTADLGGGGLLNTQPGTARIINSHLNRNRSNSTSGAILNYTGNLTIIDSTIMSNTANSGGGGMVNLIRSNATIINSRIVANLAQGNSGDGDGGGIVNGLDSTLIISNTQIVDNHSPQGNGGGIINRSATMTISNSSLISNTAGGNGGGIYSQWSKTKIENSNLFNNSDTALFNYDDSNTVTATNNWWGAANGPSGAGPGTGDSVGESVDFSDFATTPIELIDEEARKLFLPSLGKVSEVRE